MKTQNNLAKNSYIAPKIIHIQLDSEISLQLQSVPPQGPNEGASLSPEFLKNDPFRTNLG